MLVQPDAWGQLGFNLRGVTVVGAPRPHTAPAGLPGHSSYLPGGVGGIAVASAWQPADLGGGSSDAAAPLIGARTVLLAAENHDRHDRHDRSGRRT